MDTTCSLDRLSLARLLLSGYTSCGCFSKWPLPETNGVSLARSDRQGSRFLSHSRVGVFRQAVKPAAMISCRVVQLVARSDMYERQQQVNTQLLVAQGFLSAFRIASPRPAEPWLDQVQGAPETRLPPRSSRTSAPRLWSSRGWEA